MDVNVNVLFCSVLFCYAMLMGTILNLKDTELPKRFLLDINVLMFCFFERRFVHVLLY